MDRAPRHIRVTKAMTSMPLPLLSPTLSSGGATEPPIPFTL
jgi:hypothetical protein